MVLKCGLKEELKYRHMSSQPLIKHLKAHARAIHKMQNGTVVKVDKNLLSDICEYFNFSFNELYYYDDPNYDDD